MEWIVVKWLYEIILIFFVQISVAEAMIVFTLKRRKLFAVRIIGCIAVGVGFLFLMALLGAALAPYFMAGSIVYLFIFAYTLLSLWFCFDERFYAILFCGIAAYSVQNLAYRAFSILEVSGAVWEASHDIGYTAAYHILQTCTFIIAYVVLYFTFIKRLQKRQSMRVLNRNITVIAAVTLVITVFLCAWTNGYQFQHQYLLIINYLFSIICCLFILAVQSGMLERSELIHDIEVVNQMWERDRAQYEISKESVDRINILCHDLKHKIKKLRLEESGLSDEELSRVESLISVYDSKIKTGCEPLDVILTEKSLYCNRNGIKFTCMAKGGMLNCINPSDLYSLFGNILNNAIEAVGLIEDAERRSINLTVREVGGMALVQAENFYEGEVKFKDGLPQTDKDGLLHGYGMKSIKMLADKYGGEMTCKAENGVFGLAIIFPDLNKKC